MTEVAPALTLQTSLGFLLTALSIWLTFEIRARWGWGVAFAMLAVGPVVGIATILRLKSARSMDGYPAS